MFEGTLPDGSAIEFDIMEEDGVWRVVETQRDIAFADAPDQVRAAHAGGFAPGRVIESTQADGLVIYELFGEAGGDPEGRKVEIKWNGRRAEVLEEKNGRTDPLKVCSQKNGRIPPYLLVARDP